MSSLSRIRPSSGISHTCPVTKVRSQPDPPILSFRAVLSMEPILASVVLLWVLGPRVFKLNTVNALLTSKFCTQVPNTTTAVRARGLGSLGSRMAGLSQALGNFSCLLTAIALLKDKDPGAFLIRDSHSFQGAYGLALKVATPPPSAQPWKGTGCSNLREKGVELGEVAEARQAGWAVLLLDGERRGVTSPALERIPAGEKVGTWNLMKPSSPLPTTLSPQETPWNSWSAIFLLRLGPKG